MNITAFERFVSALEGHGCTVRTNGHGKAQAQCPAHDDTHPSLSITATEGRTLLYCHAGCGTEDVLAAANLTLADLYDEPFHDRRYGQVYNTYTYPDGRVVYRTADKQFPQPNRAKNEGRSLFHADRIGDATKVYVTEGEEDVFAVEAAGGVAVSPAMGAGKAAKFDWKVLRGRDVRIIADNDDRGHKHALEVAEQLDGIAKSVRILLPPSARTPAITSPPTRRSRSWSRTSRRRCSTSAPATGHGLKANGSRSWSTLSTASFPKEPACWSLRPRRAKASSSATSGWP